MKHLGMFVCHSVATFSCVLFSFFVPHTLLCTSCVYCKFLLCLFSCTVLISKSHQLQRTSSACCCYLWNLGYLGYTSGFSLSCMVFFLISVSQQRANKHTYNMTNHSSVKYLSLINKWVCLPRLSTRNSIYHVHWMITIITLLLLRTCTLPLMVQMTSVRPSYLQSTHRLEEKLSHFLFLVSCVNVRHIFICSVISTADSMPQSGLEWTIYKTSIYLWVTHRPVLFWVFRQHTPFQFWLLLLSATQRCYQSTLSYESKLERHLFQKNSN